MKGMKGRKTGRERMGEKGWKKGGGGGILRNRIGFESKIKHYE